MAHQKEFLPFLLGIGVRRLSVDPQFLSAIQKVIGGITIESSEAYAQRLLEAITLAEIEEITPYH